MLFPEEESVQLKLKGLKFVNGISLGENSCGLVNKKFLRIESNTIEGRGVRSPLISVGREMLIYELQRGGITHE
jgi:hypothetical protein